MSGKANDDTGLVQFATVRELELLDAIRLHGSQRKAAKALGLAHGTLSHAVGRLKNRAALKGYSPEHDLTHPAAPGQRLRGASTLYRRGEVEPVMQWIKTNADDDAREAIMREAVRALSEDCRGLSPIVNGPANCRSDLLAVYPLGDPHIGLYAWSKESGEDFDLDEARRLTLAAVDRLVQSAPAADTAIILPLGDVFHANDQTNVTPGHKHQLDVDSRFVKVLGIGVEVFRHTVLRALEKHARVVVRFVSGNHDPQAVWALAFTISAYFDNDPRVEVDLSPAAHWFYRFGRVLIGATHGDKSRAEQLPGVMACDRAEDWGQTRHRYWLCGHVHHSSVKEFPGVTVETFRTLAATDAYAAGHGYRAGRDMRLIVMHREHGEIERHRCDVGMLQAA